MSEKQVLVPDERHPITVTPTEGRVVVTVDGVTVAETTRALTLQESTYPAVQYVPLDDVDAAVLQPTDHTTHCPYKGDAGYYSVVVAGQTHENKVWTYEHPHDAVAPIAGHVAFYPDVAEVAVADLDPPRQRQDAVGEGDAGPAGEPAERGLGSVGRPGRSGDGGVP